MLTNETAVLKALLRMVVTLEGNFHAREDLMQEALVCFWLRQRQYPGQRRSWYLQRVKFYLHHFRASGRSLDSPKRRGAQAAFADDCDGRDDWLDSLDFDEGTKALSPRSTRTRSLTCCGIAWSCLREKSLSAWWREWEHVKLDELSTSRTNL